jgi:hypothetical protein
MVANQAEYRDLIIRRRLIAACSNRDLPDQRTRGADRDLGACCQLTGVWASNRFFPLGDTHQSGSPNGLRTEQCRGYCGRKARHDRVPLIFEGIEFVPDHRIVVGIAR